MDDLDDLIYNYVIFHKNCLDGFSSYIVLTKTNRLSNDAFIYPDIPSTKEKPPNLKNKNVIIMDVAYSESILRKIFEEANHVLFIDHHITIKNDVAKLAYEFGNKHKIVYDETMSGASLTWSYFFKKKEKEMPWFIKYIEDNDIGRWKYKNTINFILALRVKFPLYLDKETLEKWNELYDRENVKKIIKDGKKYGEYDKYLIDVNYRRYSLESFPSEKLWEEVGFFTKPGQYKVAVLNSSGCPSGNLSVRILDEIPCDFCIIWNLHLDKKEYILSFRSKSVDVGEIAKIFGGGGHKLASACSIPMSKYDITDLFFPQSLPRM